MRNPYHAIVADHYDFWSKYNDKHVDGSRRLAYCKNGMDMDVNEMCDIRDNVNADLKAANLPGFVEWIISERLGYGFYWKLTIQVPAPTVA